MAVPTRRPLALLIYSRLLALSRSLFPQLCSRQSTATSSQASTRQAAERREKMGNALPCLVDQGVKALPAAAKPRRRMYSLKLLMRVLHRMKRTPRGNKIGGKSSPESDSEVGGAGVKSVKASHGKASPRRAAAGGGGGQRKGVVRVKVLLSKEEAARLLSLTVGGQKTAAQIVAEIKRMEARRAAANAAAAAGWRPALASIPEESS
uniref:DUF7890 domain-containing protein n=3 Tax=Aegilops tauschii TaxID=37682 RepID=A0A453EFN5_AEGTS